MCFCSAICTMKKKNFHFWYFPFLRGKYADQLNAIIPHSYI